MNTAYEVSDSLKALVFQGIEAKKWMSAPYRDRTLEVLPGVFTNERYSYMLPKLYSRLHRIYEDHQGDGYGQINTDFDCILNLAGHPMNPLGVPELIERRGDVSDSLNRIHQFVCSKFTSDWRDDLSLSIAKMSHSGAPFLSHSLMYKASIIKFWIEEGDRLLNVFNKEGPEGLTKEGVFVCYIVGRRYQYDTMLEVILDRRGNVISVKEKTRKAATEKGVTMTADKRLGPNFSPFVFRTRAREVWGMSGTFNYAWQIIVQAFRSCYFEAFPKLLHHISVPDAVESLPSGGVVTSFDFKEFDHSISAQLQTNWINALEDAGVDPRLCALRRWAIRAPVFFHGGSLLDRKIYGIGSFDRAQERSSDFGVQSGIADVADIDKSVGVAVALDLGTRAHVLQSEDDWLAVMTDSHPRMRLRNMGDDTLLWFDCDESFESFKKAAASYTDFKVEPDRVPVFLGNTIVNHGSKRIALPNVARGVANILVPERGISHKLQQGVPRAFWAYGIQQRNVIYRAHPMWDEIWDTVLDELSAFSGRDMSRIIADEAVKQEREANRLYPHTSVYDQMFLMDPSYINYRLLPEQVSPSVMQEYFLTVPPEQTSIFLHRMIR